MVGVLLLLDLFVPVALVLAMPISVVVWYNHAQLNGHPLVFSMRIGCLLWNIVLLMAYLPYYLPMIRLRAQVGTLNDFEGARQLFAQRAEFGDAPESRHRAAITVLGLLLTATLAYQLHPHVEQSRGAGKTPAEIVPDYLLLAHRDGKPIEAQSLYVTPELVSRDQSLAQTREDKTLVDNIQRIVAQGSNVVVYHEIAGAAGTPDVQVVDI